jgi:hypothetical protein
MQITFILKTKAVDWAILKQVTSIGQKARDSGKYFYICVCIIKEQCSYQEERKWKCQKGSQNNVNVELCQIEWLAIVDTARAKWASKEHQRFVVMRPGKLQLQSVVAGRKGIFACLYRQSRSEFPLSPINKMRVNGVSMIVRHASWEITPPIGCC